MSASRSLSRRNKRKADAASAPISPQSQKALRRVSIGVLVLMALFIAGLSWAFSSSPDRIAAKPQQIASAVNPGSIDPLSRLKHVIPSQPSPVASLFATEGFSQENTNLMLAGFGGQGQQSTTIDYIYDGQNLVRTRKNGGLGATYLAGLRGP